MIIPQLREKEKKDKSKQKLTTKKRPSGVEPTRWFSLPSYSEEVHFFLGGVVRVDTR